MPDTGAMTGKALIGLVRHFIETVRTDKPFTDAIGFGHVAITTGGMTASAFIFKAVFKGLRTLLKTLHTGALSNINLVSP